MKMKTPILKPSWLRARWAVLVLMMSAWMTACSFLSTPKTIHVNQSLLQTAITKKWTDIAKTMSDNGMVATEPKVILMPDKQRVAAQFDAVVETGLLGGVMRGKMQMSGVPAYNPEVQAIVLKEFAVDSFELNNAPSMLDGLARRAVSMMVGKKLGGDVPVYFIKREQLSFAGKEWLPEKIEVEAERLNITLQPHEQ
ncbi:MAG: hypothetical protein H6R05_256 [Burkholderiaceae bacterium]|nr:hypothetical protein [Burkholderiaceae bacterium]